MTLTKPGRQQNTETVSVKTGHTRSLCKMYDAHETKERCRNQLQKRVKMVWPSHHSKAKNKGQRIVSL